MLVGGALETIEGVWGLFRSEPFFPYIYDKVLPLIPSIPRILVILFWFLITVIGIIVLVVIFRQTRSRKAFEDGIQPIVIAKEHEKLLIASQAEIYEVGDGSHWLRLKVENPLRSVALGCHGKLLSRKMIRGMLTKVDGVFIRPELSTEGGRLSSEHMQLPPEGHRFPWSPTDRSLTTISISGNGGFEFLYLVTKRKHTGCFWFPASAGNEHENWSLGDFELELEIGSESEAFTTTKVRVVFRAAGGDLEFVSLGTLN